MRRNAKLAAVILIIIIVAPVVPFPYPKYWLLPWSSQCAIASLPRVLAFVSLTFIFFQKGIAFVPQSSSPIQFQRSYLPTGEACG